MSRTPASLLRITVALLALALSLGACKGGWTPPDQSFSRPPQCWPNTCSFGGI